MRRKPHRTQHGSRQRGIAPLLGLLFIVFTFAPPAFADEATQYPPYPEV